MARTIDVSSAPNTGFSLSHATLFAPLEEPERRSLWNASRLRTYEAGEVLFHEEESGDLLYLLQAGWVKIVVTAPDGAETILNVYGPGGCLGELSLLDGAPRSATAVALGRVEARVLHRDDFLSLLERHPRLAQTLIQRLTGMIRRLSRQAQDAALLDIRGRLAKRLLEVAEQYGEATPQGTRIAVRLTQQEVAQMIGAARSKVNGHLTAFQSRGILTLGREGILIHRPEALWQAVAGAG
jgi:CRP/FNR family cyclic AMP-dependent transcriptional regulator